VWWKELPDGRCSRSDSTGDLCCRRTLLIVATNDFGVLAERIGWPWATGVFERDRHINEKRVHS